MSHKESQQNPDPQSRPGDREGGAPQNEEGGNQSQRGGTSNRAGNSNESGSAGSTRRDDTGSGQR
jgi:hypothetical protein